jgi:hypothetical protein
MIQPPAPTETLPSQFAAILQNVTQIAKEHKITAWWRSNTPGHYECFQYDHRERTLPVKVL